jgi:hypothetical protein
MTFPLNWKTKELHDNEYDDGWFNAIETVDPEAMDYSEFYDVHPYVGDGNIATLKAETGLTNVSVNP